MSWSETSAQKPVDEPPFIEVDSHCHVLPLRLATRIRSFFFEVGALGGAPDASQPDGCCGSRHPTNGGFAYSVDPPTLFNELVADLDEIEGEGWSQPARRKSTIWTLPYVHKAGMSRELNRAVCQLAKEETERAGSRLRVLPGLAVHPGDGGEGDQAGSLLPEEILLEAVRNGARVVKLHCSVGDHGVLDPRLKSVSLVSEDHSVGTHRGLRLAARRFFQKAEAIRIPVVIHAGHGIHGTTEASEIDDLDELAKLYHHLPIILGGRSSQCPVETSLNPSHNVQAHSGHPNTQRALDLAFAHRNV